MPPCRHKTGVLSLAACVTLALTSCAADPEGEETGLAGTGDGQAPDEWGETPGIVTHSDDRQMLFLLDPETGEELDSLDLDFGEDAPDYGFRVSGDSFITTAFSPDFRYMARITGEREGIDLYRLPGREPVRQYETGSESLSSTDTRVKWLGFVPNGEELVFLAQRDSTDLLHSIDVEGEGEPQEIGSWETDTGEETPFGWTWDNEHLHGEEYSHSQDGTDGKLIESEGIRADGNVLPGYIRIWADGKRAGPNEEYEDFVRTEDGTYIGASINRSSPPLEDPAVGHLIGFTLDDEGEVTDWSEISEANGIDAFALSPDEGQIAVSEDGDVFLLPADGSAEETRLDQDENQDHRVLGWF